MANILLVAGCYHLGDNAGAFQHAVYVGHALELPFKKTWIDPAAQTVTFLFATTDVETWGDWKGHAVTINGSEIGRLKDATDAQGPREGFSIPVRTSSLNALLNGRDEFTLRIELETQTAFPGMADDFIITRIETDGTLAAKLGWK